MTTAQLADGRTLEFPDGTDPLVIQNTVKKVLGISPTAGKPVEPTAFEKEASFLKNVTPSEAFLGSAPGRFLTGAASLPIGALQKTLEAISPTGAEWLGNTLQSGAQMEARGRQAQGSEGFDWAKLAGGMATPIPIAAGLAPAATMAGKMAQGAMVGGTVGSLMPVVGGDYNTGALENTGMGAAGGAVLAPVAAGVARGAGYVKDLVTGRQPEVKAAQILREVAGADLPGIRAHLQAAPNDQTAAQAAFGINRDTWNALGELAASTDKESYFSRLSASQKAKVTSALQQLAGGQNQSAAKDTSALSKNALNNTLSPVRDTILENANYGGKVGVPLQNEASALADAAAAKVGDVRRLGNAQQIAEDVAQSGAGRLSNTVPGNPPAAGNPRLAGRYSYAQELNDLAERIAGKSAEDSLILGQAAKFKQMQLDSLAAHGLKPINTTKITGALEAEANSPPIAGNKQAKDALNEISRVVREWTDKGGGVIDAEALDAIRKNAVNSVVDQFMGTADPKAKQRYATSLLMKVKPLIVDAMESAGGTGYRDYLKAYEEGMRQIERQKMGAVALGLLNKAGDKSAKRLESLAAGNEPKMVEKVFKTEHDLSRAMNGQEQPIVNAADFMQRERMMRESASRGQGGLSEILGNYTNKWTIPNLLNRSIAVTNRTLAEIETQVNKATMTKLKSAMKSGQSALDLLDTLPSKDRGAVLKLLQNDPVMAGSGVGGVLSSRPVSGVLQEQQ